MNRTRPIFVALLLLSLLTATRESQAYVGPGAGLGMLGALIGLVVAIFTALWVLFRGVVRKVLQLPARKVGAKPPDDRPDS